MVALPFLGFYLINFTENTIFFGLMFVVLRIIQGIGVSMAQTSIYSILTLTYPDKINYVVGMIEMAAGSGISFGPVCGAILFDFGGISTPFLSFFAICLMLSFIVSSVIPGDADKGSESLVEVSDISYLKLLSNKRILFANLSIVLMMLQFTFLDPIFAHYLHYNFNIEYQHSGFFFFVLGLGYTFSCMFVHHATKFFKNRNICICAAVLVGIFTIFYGPSHIIPTGYNLVLVIFGLFFAGIFDAFMCVPTMDEMIEAGSQELNLTNNPEILSDISSGLFNMSYSTGEIIGPLVGNLMYTHLGFGMTTDIYGVLLITFGIVYLLMMLNVKQ